MPGNFNTLTNELAYLRYSGKRFLGLSRDVQDHNNRLIFLSLVLLPSKRDIDQYVTAELLSFWTVDVKHQVIFYRIDADTMLPVVHKPLDKADVKRYYTKRKREIQMAMDDFISFQGQKLLLEIAQDKTLTDNAKIDALISFRVSCDIPTKAPLNNDGYGILRFDFPRIRSVSVGVERALRCAAGLQT